MSAAEADLAEVQDELADLYMLFSTVECAQVEWCFRHAERVLYVLICPLPHVHLQKPIKPQSLGVMFSLIVLKHAQGVPVQMVMPACSNVCVHQLLVAGTCAISRRLVL